MHQQKASPYCTGTQIWSQSLCRRPHICDKHIQYRLLRQKNDHNPPLLSLVHQTKDLQEHPMKAE
jgi:hypothetical protein